MLCIERLDVFLQLKLMIISCQLSQPTLIIGKDKAGLLYIVIEQGTVTAQKQSLSLRTWI